MIMMGKSIHEMGFTLQVLKFDSGVLPGPNGAKQFKMDRIALT